MRLATPLYDGDSIIRPAPESARTIENEDDGTSKFVQRNGPLGPEIEAPARAERAAAIALYARRFWRWLAARLDGARRSHEEAFLAQTQSLSEVERRIRELERGSLRRI